MKTLDTLPQDIYQLFDPDADHVVSEENLDTFSKNLREVLKSRLAKQNTEGRNPLRFSALGKRDRQLWMEGHPDPANPPEPMTPKTYIKFLYGAIIEELMLFLIKEAGHTVEDEQREVEVDGVKGHIDCKVDGVLVDIKSASSFGYAKFKNNKVLEDDPFGYVAQLSGYSNVLTPGQDAAWIANDKESGAICVSPLSSAVIDHYKPEDRIKELKEVLASDTPPPVCNEPIPDGKSGNMKLATQCSYCAHKFRCFPSIRTFIYSTGPRYLTTVARVPDVYEVI